MKMKIINTLCGAIALCIYAAAIVVAAIALLLEMIEQKRPAHNS